ncbi:caspase-3-like [Strongylocentrotus purpuratus]|uniref:Uncharacterized protein n=1 Tax=Strongylocentrotus purpuratus TaxID=7668 RepID=A0A7M7NCW7_STRPU|nr:caspase-3-like [Strongylocentrotus purpuratus]
MNDDFSLIIRNITVSDQGTYTCIVTNYEGILIHNFTEVNVFAPPMEPFPLIDECRGILPNDAEQTCSLSTSDNITITCSASSYFPDIDLFFSHGSKQMDATNVKEDVNMDGTKSKSISIVAEPSESPFVCVASDIPGSQDQKTVTVTVTFIGSTTLSLSGVVVPVVIVIILILAAIWCAVLWRRRSQRRSQVKPDSNGFYKQTIKQAYPSQEQLDPEKNYKMDDKEKGLMFLFNMTKDRKGSDVDVRNIQHVFTEIGYEIETHSDLTAEDLQDKLETFAGYARHHYMPSAVFVIMGNGSSTGIHCTDEPVTYKFIENKVSRMKYMKGKPKMIFFQGNREKAKEETEADIDMEISDASDLLVVHSTTSGNVPDRSVIRGSRFIQMLCKELLKNAHVSDLSTMLEQVTRKVGKKTFNHKYDKTPEVIKQGISKKIYFLPKYPPEETE